MITIITLEGVVERDPQEYKRVKGGDTMANIKRTKLVLRFNIGTEDAPKYKDVTYTRVAEEASDDNVKPLVMRWQPCMTTACPTWSASMKYL